MCGNIMSYDRYGEEHSMTYVISITSLLHEKTKYNDVLSANFVQLGKIGGNIHDFGMMPAFIES